MRVGLVVLVPVTGEMVALGISCLLNGPAMSSANMSLCTLDLALKAMLRDYIVQDCERGQNKIYD